MNFKLGKEVKRVAPILILFIESGSRRIEPKKFDPTNQKLTIQNKEKVVNS